MATGDKKQVVMAADRSVANGVATLGADALLAAAQRPKAGGLYRDDGTTTVEESLTEISTTLQNNDPRQWGIGKNFNVLPAPYDADTITLGGIYVVKQNSPTGDWATVLHIPYGDNRATQIGILASDNYKECWCKRDKYAGTWEPWGWVNPPMKLGVEYRTTERYLGKPVYTQARSVPSGPALNSITIVTFSGSEGVTEFVDYGGSLTDGNFMLAIPGVNGAGDATLDAGPIRTTSASVLQIYMKNVGSFDLTSYSGTCWVKYTKG